MWLEAYKLLAQKAKEKSKGTKKPIHETFSNNTYNRCLVHIHKTFEILTNERVIMYNPAKSIKNLPVVKDDREKLEVEGRAELVKTLAPIKPNFLRYMKMFFHSGCRATEMMKLQVKDVNLAKQVSKVEVLKGGIYKM